MQAPWTFEKAKALMEKPFFDLMLEAHGVHRQHHDPRKIQISSLLNIKTGSCPENCAYCPQSAHYDTGLARQKLMPCQDVVAAAKRAQAVGGTRFCMGAAWRGPNDQDLEAVCEMIREVKALGMETCATLGLLKEHQAKRLKEAGLDFYNHNIDTSPEYYDKIITTRTFQDRLETLRHVSEAGMKVCCGGILGMGETNDDRLNMLVVLANLETPPESVPINQLVPIPGTPLEHAEPVNAFDFVRVVAIARIMMPKAYVRLSAGRGQGGLSSETQAWCFFAGVNSIFYGEVLLVTENATPKEDDLLFAQLNLEKMEAMA